MFPRGRRTAHLQLHHITAHHICCGLRLRVSPAGARPRTHICPPACPPRLVPVPTGESAKMANRRRSYSCANAYRRTVLSCLFSSRLVSSLLSISIRMQTECRLCCAVLTVLKRGGRGVRNTSTWRPRPRRPAFRTRAPAAPATLICTAHRKQAHMPSYVPFCCDVRRVELRSVRASRSFRRLRGARPASRRVPSAASSHLCAEARLCEERRAVHLCVCVSDCEPQRKTVSIRHWIGLSGLSASFRLDSTHSPLSCLSVSASCSTDSFDLCGGAAPLDFNYLSTFNSIASRSD